MTKLVWLFALLVTYTCVSAVPPGCWPSGTQCRAFIQHMVYCCGGGSTWSEEQGWCVGWWDAPPCDGGGGGGGGGLCFSTDATVSVKGKGNKVPIMDLRLNDQVLANANGLYSKVYAFGNRNQDRTAAFTRIETAFTTLDLTPNHMLYLANQTMPVPAVTIKAGDELQVVPNDAAFDSGNRGAVVLHVTHDVIKTTGIITPVTVSGTIVVNGVVASNYAGKHGSANYFGNRNHNHNNGILSLHYHDISHVAVAPLRFVCTIISSSFCSLAYHYSEESEDHPGQHSFFAIVHALKHFVKSDVCGPLLHALLFVVVIGTGLVFFILERGVLVASLMAMVAVLVLYKGHKNTATKKIKLA